MLNSFPTNFTTGQIITFVIITIWSIIWKGLALWKAGRKDHLTIFIVLLILNTVGIAEIIYLVYLYFKDKKSGTSLPPSVPTQA